MALAEVIRGLKTMQVVSSFDGMRCLRNQTNGREISFVPRWVFFTKAISPSSEGARAETIPRRRQHLR